MKAKVKAKENKLKPAESWLLRNRWDDRCTAAAAAAVAAAVVAAAVVLSSAVVAAAAVVAAVVVAAVVDLECVYLP
jgi:hypothetical protein